MDANVADKTVENLLGAELLHEKDLKVANEWNTPNRVKPQRVRTRIMQSGVHLKLPTPSMAVLRIKLKERSRGRV